MGLYTLIRATPSLDREVSRKNYIYTSCLPGLSIIQGTKFAPAPNDATINTPGAVHIFDVQALGNMTAELDDVFCIPMDHGFNPWRKARPRAHPDRFYWRLHMKPSVILAQILPMTMTSMHKDIRIAVQLRCPLFIRHIHTVRGDSKGEYDNGGGKTLATRQVPRGNTNWL